MWLVKGERPAADAGGGGCARILCDQQTQRHQGADARPRPHSEAAGEGEDIRTELTVLGGMDGEATDFNHVPQELTSFNRNIRFLT